MNGPIRPGARRAAVGRRQISRMPDYEIEISNQQTTLAVDHAFLKRVATNVLRDERVARAVISIAIVDHSALRRLNQLHLGHDYDTDVLSFLLECDETQQDPVDIKQPPRRGAGKRLEGEVIASADMARDRAAEFHHAPQDELTLYVVHGLLHLVGYDDQTDAEQSLMRAREREILARLAGHP